MKSGLPKRFWILAWLAIGTLVLGTLGLLGPSIANGRGAGAGQGIDALLEATSYLTLNGFGPVEQGLGGWDSVAAWSIRVARLLALLFVVIGIGVVVDALLGEFGNWRFRLRADGLFGPRHLDLVCGLAGPGLAFIDNTCNEDNAANKRTLAIDAAPSARAIDACRRRKVPLLVKDAGDETVLDSLDLDRIKRVFIGTGSDEANLRILVRLVEQVRHAGHGDDILCVVHLADTVAYASVLKALPQCDRLDLRVFNTESVTVRELYRLPLDRRKEPEGLKGVHLVAVGDGPMVDELVLQALHLNIHEPGLLLEVDILCGQPAASADAWLSRRGGHRRLGGKNDGDGAIRLVPGETWGREKENVLPEIAFHRLSSVDGERIEWCEKHCVKPGWATTFIIALEGANAAAAVALGLAETLRVMAGEQDVELWIHVRDGHLDEIRHMFDRGEFDLHEARPMSNAQWLDMDRSGGKGNGRLTIRLFRDYLGECSRDLAVAEDTEEAAKRVNLVYQTSGKENQDQLLLSEKMKDEAWRKCNAVDRESSRQAAVHARVQQRIRDMRGRLPGEEGSREDLLVRINHRRWCAQQLLAGMRPLLTDIPSSENPDEWNAEDLKLAREWFGLPDGSGKRSWKERGRHIDLMPFDSLECLDAVEPGRGRKEQDKDQTFARYVDYIVDGVKGLGQPPVSS